MHRGGNANDESERSSGTDETPHVRIDPRTIRGTPPSLLIQRFIKGDPLDLELRCRLKQESSGLLISRPRMFLRAAARSAHRGFFYDPDSDSIEPWIAKRIEETIADLLDEDRISHWKNLPTKQPEHYGLLMKHLGLKADVARAAHVAFNELPVEVRTAYFRIGIQGMHPESYSSNGGGTRDEIHDRILLAVNTLVQFRMMDGEGEPK